MIVKNTYQQLERSFVTYKDLLSIEVQENGEDFVILPDSVENFGVTGNYSSLGDMKEIFPFVPVRKSVKEKLDNVDAEIKKINKNFQLVVAYGYRSLEVQKNYFTIQKKILQEMNPYMSSDEIDEQTHRLIAVPEVAGHPTGGAIDVYIQDMSLQSSIDFGTPLFSFDSKDVYTFSDNISIKAKEARQILRQSMMNEGFAPYDGEWWHFSLGDKEWAFYYQKSNAFYAQKTADFVLESLKKYD